eukprot:2238159-Pyramimonas_sp.AAC.1
MTLQSSGTRHRREVEGLSKEKGIPASRQASKLISTLNNERLASASLRLSTELSWGRPQISWSLLTGGGPRSSFLRARDQ